MLFSLNPGVTRDSRVTPGLPLDSKSGHETADTTAGRVAGIWSCR